MSYLPTNQGHDRRPTTPLVALVVPWTGCAAGLAAVFWAAYAFFVATPEGQLIDNAALVGALHFMDAESRRRPAMEFLDALPAICVVVAVLALLLAALRGRALMPSVIAAASFACAALSTQVLKHRLLERPNHGISEATMNSFPSGHSAVAAAAMFTLLLISPPAYRAWVTVIGGGFAALAGASTLLLGWHRPADVLAAYLVAAFWAVLGAAGLALWSALAGGHRAVMPTQAVQLGRIPRLLAVLGSLGTVAGAGVWLLVPARGPVEADQARYLLVLAAALVLILSMAMLLSLGLHRLMSRYRVDAGVRLGRERGMK